MNCLRRLERHNAHAEMARERLHARIRKLTPRADGDSRTGLGILEGVVVAEVQVEVCADRAELVVGQVWSGPARNRDGIAVREHRSLQTVMREAGAQDAHVKLRVVRDDELPCKMRLEFRPDAGKIGGICRIGL